jgi:lysophospholipid acyltransferase (LPLAT)-like uncharacterized protein
MLAKKTGNPILPFVIECSSYWQIKSWDRLQIPRPFSRARVLYAKPIFVSDEAGNSEVEAKLVELQNSLDELVGLAKEWGQSQ